jgi:hypothetical protein
MAIVQFPVERLGDAERMALRQGVVKLSRVKPSLRLIEMGRVAPAYCAACAAPIDFGAVWRGEEIFCSVECSLGGNRPA